jgi:hypothetical protein
MMATMTIPTFTPVMLALFERCPQQYFLKYIQKRKVPETFSPDLACGNAAHTVLHGVLAVYQRTGGYPINLRERVEDALPSHQYSCSDAWTIDVERVLSWVKGGLISIDETAQVIAVERWMEYLFPGTDDCPSFRLRHRLDLILEHEDEVLEHRDWKGARAPRWTSCNMWPPASWSATPSGITHESSVQRSSCLTGSCKSTN